MAHDAPPLAGQFVEGRAPAVPCPHCGKPNDFTEIAEEIVQVSGLGALAQERGQIVVCDHCDREMEVVRIKCVTLIAVRQA